MGAAIAPCGAAIGDWAVDIGSCGAAIVAWGVAMFSCGDAIDGTFSTHYNRAISDLGQALSSTNSRLDDQANVTQIVRGQRDSISAVSLDEEMADLLKFQRAFQASSRVFTTVDQLLDNVVNQLGR